MKTRIRKLISLTLCVLMMFSSLTALTGCKGDTSVTLLAAPANVRMEKDAAGVRGYLKWSSVTGAKAYNIKVNGTEFNGITTVMHNVASAFTATGDYNITVNAVDADGTKGDDGVLNVKATKLAAPVVSIDSDEDGDFFVWSAVANVDGYEYSTDGGTAWTVSSAFLIMPPNSGDDPIQVSLLVRSLGNYTGTDFYINSDAAEAGPITVNPRPTLLFETKTGEFQIGEIKGADKYMLIINDDYNNAVDVTNVTNLYPQSAQNPNGSGVLASTGVYELKLVAYNGNTRLIASHVYRFSSYYLNNNEIYSFDNGDNWGIQASEISNIGMNYSDQIRVGDSGYSLKVDVGNTRSDGVLQMNLSGRFDFSNDATPRIISISYWIYVEKPEGYTARTTPPTYAAPRLQMPENASIESYPTFLDAENGKTSFQFNNWTKMRLLIPDDFKGGVLRLIFDGSNYFWGITSSTAANAWDSFGGYTCYLDDIYVEDLELFDYSDYDFAVTGFSNKSLDEGGKMGTYEIPQSYVTDLQLAEGDFVFISGTVKLVNLIQGTKVTEHEYRSVQMQKPFNASNAAISGEGYVYVGSKLPSSGAYSTWPANTNDWVTNGTTGATITNWKALVGKNASGNLVLTFYFGNFYMGEVFAMNFTGMTSESRQKVEAAKLLLTWDSIKGNNDTESNVTDNLGALPLTIGNGVAISWSSGDTAVVSNTGVVSNPPADSPDANVMLTATLKYGGASGTVTFDLTVKALDVPDAENVSRVKDGLTWDSISGGNDSASNVTENLATLPTTLGNGVTVSWSSSNTAAVSGTGVVTRPTAGAGNASVTLTATLSKGSASDTVTFNLTIIELPYSASFAANLDACFVLETDLAAGTDVAVSVWIKTTGWYAGIWTYYINGEDEIKDAKIGAYSGNGSTEEWTQLTFRATVFAQGETMLFNGGDAYWNYTTTAKGVVLRFHGNDGNPATIQYTNITIEGVPTLDEPVLDGVLCYGASTWNYFSFDIPEGYDFQEGARVEVTIEFSVVNFDTGSAVYDDWLAIGFVYGASDGDDDFAFFSADTDRAYTAVVKSGNQLRVVFFNNQNFGIALTVAVINIVAAQ